MKRYTSLVNETDLSVAVNQEAWSNSGLRPLSQNESVAISAGGEQEGWDYELAEYLGMGVGYGVKKLWKALKFISSNLYKMRDNPLLLYQ